MSAPYIPPWDPNFTNEINAVTSEVTDAANAAIGAATQTVNTAIATGEAAVVPAVTGAVQAATGAATAATQATTTGLGTALHDAIVAAQHEAAQQVEKAAIDALKRAVPAAPTDPIVLEPKDITNAAARGRALRTFFYGMGLTIFWALVTAIGDAASGGQVDFFTKTGWISVATLAIATIAHAVLSYLGRIKFSPNTPE